MITKQAIGDYIDACRKANLAAETILDQLEIYITNATHEYEITEVEILKEGDFST